MSDAVYLDYAATSPLDPLVREAMLECMDARSEFGNPSAGHGFGSRAAARIDRAAEQVAGAINAQPEEIVWTSGATESDNLGVIGAARFRRLRGRHVVTTAIEHKAVLASCAQLEREGFTVSYLMPDKSGAVLPATVAAAIRPDTSLVSVMHANNETGVINDIAAIGRICRENDLWLHVDAAQTLGRLRIDTRADHIDLLTINAHKTCGPKGVGALVLNSERVRRVEPLLFGGGQQRGIRPGTLPVHQVVGMGATAALAAELLAGEVPRVAALRDSLWEGISDLPGLMQNGDPGLRLCSILSVSVSGIEGESLRYALEGIAVSAGSACNSAQGEPSYVLRALGRSDALAESTVRFSLGRFTTAAEVDRAVRQFRKACSFLGTLAPEGKAG